MNNNRCLQVSDADFSINNFIDRDFISSDLKERILSCSILFLPLLDFRESERPLFHNGTSDFYNFVRGVPQKRLKFVLMTTNMKRSLYVVQMSILEIF